jgi:hypothetical protein
MRVRFVASGARRCSPSWLPAAGVVFFITSVVLGRQVGAVTLVVGSASPGVSQTFTFTATYPGGDSPEMDMAITNDPNGNANGCYFVWQEAGGLSLYDDSSGNWNSVQLGAPGTAANAHCSD